MSTPPRRGARTSPTRSLLAGAAALGVALAVGGCSETSSTAPDAAVERTAASRPADDGPLISAAPNGDDAAAGTRRAPLRSLGAALAKADAGTTILLAGGAYPAVQTSRRFGRAVRILGPGRGTAATVAGLNAVGARGLSFRRVSFSDTVTLTNSAANLARETGEVAFRHVRFTTPDARTACLAPRNGTHDLTVESSRFRRCFDGIASAGVASRSGHPIRRILVRGNDLRGMRSDGLNFAYWEDARIERNTITDLHDPDGAIHNDAIQIMGGSRRIAIHDNVLTDSRVQLLFVEPTIGGPVRDLSVENNLLVGAGAAAVQMIDTPRLRFVGNTVADSRFQGLMLRHSPKQPAPSAADGAVIANNVLAAGYLREPGVTLRLQAHNLLAGEITGGRGRGDVVGGASRVTGALASTRVVVGGAGGVVADRQQWRHRPRTGPAARTVGYVPRKDWR
ncbi:right-handed parallel beta-helix repeat-containing protein [Patulibacter sp. NPDC049589]|uniref:right-handed parallel beta-helix repeat-containing protein n=1 Tax=Patulibacter sp. NPDC049589 TaxID=3154731 RepID=UPI00342189B6